MPNPARMASTAASVSSVVAGGSETSNPSDFRTSRSSGAFSLAHCESSSTAAMRARASVPNGSRR